MSAPSSPAAPSSEPPQQPKPPQPKPVNSFHEFTRLPPNDQLRRIASEYSDLSKLDQIPVDRYEATFATALHPKNKDKSRYIDVIANEATIYPHPSTGRYINGNLIAKAITGADRDFVACQAPPPETFEDFWNVVVESRATVIINLTGIIEAGKIKSHAYWPSKVGAKLTAGESSVTLLEERGPTDSGIKDTCIRRLKHEPSGAEFTVAHYLGWPDMGVPTTSQGVRELVSYVAAASPPETPVFVHCSAGIGRTGTLIASYAVNCLASANALEENSILSIVRGLKLARTGMVQRREQYQFIFQYAFEEMRNRERQRDSQV